MADAGCRGRLRAGAQRLGHRRPADPGHGVLVPVDRRRGPAGPVRVLIGADIPLASCRATATIDARWGNGFVATVTVRNTGKEPLDGWRVSWRWSGDERVQTVWGGVAEAAGVDVKVRNASYNGTLALDAVTTFGMLVTTSAVPDGLTMACAR